MIFFLKLIVLKTLIMFNVFFPLTTHSVHHHSRVMVNLLEGTKYYMKKRLLIFNLDGEEKEIIEQSLISNLCEIKNRKLSVFFTKNKNYFNFLENETDYSLNFYLPFKVSLIGLDGDLKYKSEEYSELNLLLDIIDRMPLRKSEIKYDQTCK